MTDYTIAAIPTVYRGRQYRSRLEAKWAAFFDQLGIRHEYEPFDLGAWSPDFLLTDLRVLVEIKPLTAFDGDVWEKMSKAMLERQRGEAILLSRVAPSDFRDMVLDIGWFGLSEGDRYVANRAFVGWLIGECEPTLTADIITSDAGYWLAASGRTGRLGGSRVPESYHSHAKALWAAATNSVQWQGPK